MGSLTFFTKTYREDTERFLLLRKSIKRLYKGEARHFVVVPRDDLPIFKKITRGDDVELLCENRYVLPKYYPKKWYEALKKVAPGQAWRFSSHAGRPGWIVQQIVKLNLPEIVPDGPVAIIDSDLFFVKPFDDHDLITADTKRVLVRTEPTTESGKHRKDIEKAREILCLPTGNSEHHYMGGPAILYLDWIKELSSYLELKHKKHWQEVLYEAENFSEYSIYGIFVEEVLKPQNLVIRQTPFHYSIWDQKSYVGFMSEAWDPGNDRICVIFQSNLGISPREYSKRVENYWDQKSSITSS